MSLFARPCRWRGRSAHKSPAQGAVGLLRGAPAPAASFSPRCMGHRWRERKNLHPDHPQTGAPHPCPPNMVHQSMPFKFGGSSQVVGCVVRFCRATNPCIACAAVRLVARLAPATCWLGTKKPQGHPRWDPKSPTRDQSNPSLDFPIIGFLKLDVFSQKVLSRFTKRTKHMLPNEPNIEMSSMIDSRQALWWGYALYM